MTEQELKVKSAKITVKISPPVNWFRRKYLEWKVARDIRRLYKLCGNDTELVCQLVQKKFNEIMNTQAVKERA